MRYLEEEDIVFATGVYLRWNGKKFEVAYDNANDLTYGTPFEDDTYFDGKYVEDIENKPYIMEDEEE